MYHPALQHSRVHISVQVATGWPTGSIAVSIAVVLLPAATPAGYPLKQGRRNGLYYGQRWLPMKRAAARGPSLEQAHYISQRDCLAISFHQSRPSMVLVAGTTSRNHYRPLSWHFTFVILQLLIRCFILFNYWIEGHFVIQDNTGSKIQSTFLFFLALFSRFYNHKTNRRIL